MSSVGPTAVPASHRREFKARISRRLTLLLALLILGGLAVGGASVVLAFRIVENHDAVVREYDHVFKVDSFHAAFHDLIFELHQLDSTGGHERSLEAQVVQEELFRALNGIAGRHDVEPDAEIPDFGPVAKLLERAGSDGISRRDDLVLQLQ